MGYAKPTQARLIDQRARRRATQDLIAENPERWKQLYEQHRQYATEEAEQLALAVTPNEHAPKEPPRLMPGARKLGESAIDRIDVARCPFCVKHHDRGHRCSSCGQRPLVSRETVVEALAHGYSVDHVARTFGLKRSTVQKMREEASRVRA